MVNFNVVNRDCHGEIDHILSEGTTWPRRDFIARFTVISLSKTSARFAARRIRSNFNLFRWKDAKSRKVDRRANRPSIGSNKTIDLSDEVCSSRGECVRARSERKSAELLERNKYNHWWWFECRIDNRNRSFCSSTKLKCLRSRSKKLIDPCNRLSRTENFQKLRRPTFRDFTALEEISAFSNRIECSSHRRRNREKRIFSMKFRAWGTRQICTDPWTSSLYRWRLNGKSSWIFSLSRRAIRRWYLKANGTTIELWTKPFFFRFSSSAKFSSAKRLTMSLSILDVND